MTCFTYQLAPFCVKCDKSELYLGWTADISLQSLLLSHSSTSLYQA